MSETPQRHSHSGPGDGGSLSLSDILGPNETVLKLIDSGTTSQISDGGSETVTLSNTNVGAVLDARVTFADETELSGTTVVGTNTVNSGVLQYDKSSGNWELLISNNTGSSVTFKYEVYKL